MDPILSTDTAFTSEQRRELYEADFLSKCKVLVVGAGGLGCEMLKNLVYMNFKHIHVIDMDTIDLSNLNRQFLFRETDIGKSKALVAASAISSTTGVNIEAHYCQIQDKDSEFYRQFDLVISGLDSIEARRWLNATLCGLVTTDADGNIDPTSIIPLVDGGTEGFKGNSRVILPKVNACFECNLDLFPKPTKYPVCTIANTPRLPEHCIEWAAVLHWPKMFPDTALDPDNEEHLDFILKKATERANIFHIPGITPRLVLGVVKNVIPAIATTNAIIAASCCLEAFKLVTGSARHLNNYFLYNGGDGIYSYAFENERNAECLVCSMTEIDVEVNCNTLVKEFVQIVKQMFPNRVSNPSLRSTRTIYMTNPPSLEKSTRTNLDKKLLDFVAEGESVYWTEKFNPITLTFKILIKENRKRKSTE